MQITASALICSRSNSSRVLTSNTRTWKLLLPWKECNVSGKSACGIDGVPCCISGDRDAPLSAMLEGFLGTSGDLMGEAGLLLKLSTLGMGVLEGRGPGSMDRIGNGLDGSMGDMGACIESGGWFCGGWFSVGLSPVYEYFVEPVTEGCTAGSFNASISSSSSIEGKAWLKSVRLIRLLSRGEDDADDAGDGGPKLEAGIGMCGEDVVIVGEVTPGDGIRGDGRFWMDIRCGLGISGDLGCDALDTDGVGGIEAVNGIVGVVGTDGSCRSLDMRLEVTFVGLTARPAFWSARIRSAMLPPPDFTTGSSASSTSGSLNEDQTLHAFESKCTYRAAAALSISANFASTLGIRSFISLPSCCERSVCKVYARCHNHSPAGNS